jgi:hypothetical protein
MAVWASVTVSMAALIRGIYRRMAFVRYVNTSTSRGRIADSAGTRRTSSKVRLTSIFSDSILHSSSMGKAKVLRYFIMLDRRCQGFRKMARD